MSHQMTYRIYLTREFEKRCRKNSSYSLRAFARDLEILPSRLSEILRFQSGLSATTAAGLIPKLKLTGLDAEYFTTMVDVEHSRSLIKRNQAKHRLELLQQRELISWFDTEKAIVISEWFYSAILELTDIVDFQSDEKWIAKRLGISLEQTQIALQRLFQFGLLKVQNGNWIQTEHQLTFNSDSPNIDFKKHHLQILEKAQNAILNENPEKREISTVTLAISIDELPLIKKYLSKTRKKLMLDAAKSEKKDRVYALCLHLFPIDKV